jgi:hypothetical protein
VTSRENGLNERLMDPEHTVSAQTLQADMLAQEEDPTVGFMLAIQQQCMHVCAASFLHR